MAIISAMRSAVVLCPALVAVLALAGCTDKSATLSADPLSTGSLEAPQSAGAGGSFLKTKALSDAWAANPGDEKLGLEYATSLGKLGQPDQQIEVLKAISVAHPNDGAIQSRIGKQLLAANRPGEAVTVLERAAQSNGGDWKTLSALGTAYDQQGQYQMAREQYSRALQLSPNQLSVQNNVAMSYALEGKLQDAEKTLRTAMAQPNAPSQPRIRQNLALVVGLQGRFDEAKQIASADLPPDKVEANLAYLRQMLAKPNPWAQLADQSGAN